MKYVKRPVIIDAFDTSLLLTLYAEAGIANLPGLVCIGFEEGLIDFERDHIKIVTLEGVMIAREGSMLVRGIQGEWYPVAGSVFKKTYDRIPAKTYGTAVAKASGEH